MNREIRESGRNTRTPTAPTHARIGKFCPLVPSLVPSEASIEQHLTHRVKALGGLSWKFTSPGKAGVPDRIIVLPQGRVAFIEVKRPGSKPRAIQQKRIQELTTRGALAFVVDSYQAIEEALHAIQTA